MPTECDTCPLRKIPLFSQFSAEEVESTRRFKAGELQIDAGTPILSEGAGSLQLFTALKGMGLRYKLLPNGDRQVINFIFPGDFIGLQAAMMGEMGHSVEATTAMRLCVFNRAEFFNFFKSNPSRAYDLTWLSAVEEHFLGDGMVTLGQRSALQKMAWALTRIYQRGEAVGLVANQMMPFPFRQQDMADALGLSLVHTNKTLARLREKQLVSWSDGELRVGDLEALAEVAEMPLEPLPVRPLI